MLQVWFERVAPAVMCALFVVAAIPGGGSDMAFRLGWLALGAAVIAAIALKTPQKYNPLARAVTNRDGLDQPEGSLEG
jgi:hypothetical protein